MIFILDFLGPLTLIFYFVIGILIGIRIFPARYVGLNNTLQVVCLVVVLFCVGVSIGSSPTLWQDVRVAGWQSICYAVGTIVGSIGVVYVITRILFKEENKK